MWYFVANSLDFAVYDHRLRAVYSSNISSRHGDEYELCGRCNWRRLGLGGVGLVQLGQKRILGKRPYNGRNREAQ